MARVMVCAEKVERLMQGLDPGDAMDDSAEDEAPEDDEVRTTLLPRRLLALAVAVGCRSLVAGRWLSVGVVGSWLLVAEEEGWPESVLGCGVSGGGRGGRGVLTLTRSPAAGSRPNVNAAGCASQTLQGLVSDGQ